MSHALPESNETRLLNLHNFAPGAAQPSYEGLTVFIKNASEEVLRDQSVVLPAESGAIPPATMLGAVTYCYASDVYESERIERKLGKDLKTTVGTDLPGASAIRRFRRLNRDVIVKVLEKAFRLLRRKQKSVEVGDDTVAMARTEAERKVQLASLLDRPH